jgi:hypothetical protein
MYGSKSKIPSKNLVRQLCAKVFNSGVKGLREFLSDICIFHSSYVVLVHEEETNKSAERDRHCMCSAKTGKLASRRVHRD